MKRPYLVVSAFVFVFLVGTVISQAEKPPKKAVAEKKSEPEKTVKAAEGRIRHSGAKAIKAALKKPIHCDLKDVPLEDAIEYFAETLQIEIVLDLEWLREEGIDPHKPISCRFHDLRFAKVLSRMLDQLHLGWAIHDDVLLITSEKAIPLETRVYDVADLIGYQDDRGQQRDLYEPLIDAINETIFPVAWSHNGGRGSIDGVSLGKAKILIVSQTSEVHHEIARLLAKIRVVAANKSHQKPTQPSPAPAGKGGTNQAVKK